MVSKLSIHQKETILLSSDLSVLFVLVYIIKQTWDEEAFKSFIASVHDASYKTILPSITFIVCLLALPLLPKPKQCTGEVANEPTKRQAWTMLATTWIVEYSLVFILFYYCDCVHGISQQLNPYYAGFTVHALLLALPLKDELLCRFVFRDYISRKKLNCWPYTVYFIYNAITRFVAFMTFGSIAFSALGLSEYKESIFNSPLKSFFRIWAEAMTATFLTDLVGMDVLHRWMHTNAYFLHKWHHAGKADLIPAHSYSFDLLDLIFEFGGGIPQTCFLKWCLGMNPTTHLLSFHLALYSGINAHSMNPYSVYFFNPILDYMARNNICHNLHHTVQLDYYTGIPFKQFVSAETRRKDIERYNKDMKTQFPSDV